jgi:hypothetical protein
VLDHFIVRLAVRPAHSMVYSMPAQPPFLTPMRTAAPIALAGKDCS